MLTLIGLIAVVIWIGNRFGDHAGTVALAVLLVFLGVLFVSGWRDTDKAYGNWVDYWKDEDRRNRR